MADGAGGSADEGGGAAAAAPKRAPKKKAVAPVDPMVRIAHALLDSSRTRSLSLSWRARDPPRVRGARS